MEELLVSRRERDSEEISEDGEGQVRRHGVIQGVVDWKTDEKEEDGVGKCVEVDIGQSSPSLRASWRSRVLSWYWW